MSSPNVLRGATAERTRMGAAAVTLAAAGKVTSCENTDEFTAAEEVALQVTDMEAALAVAARTHLPAFAAVVAELDRHAHAEHPAVSTADMAQQQPPRHVFVPQSNALVQFSPGEDSRHDPDDGRHLLQPSVTAAGLQQLPPRHAPVRHVEPATQDAPLVDGVDGKADTVALDVTRAVASMLLDDGVTVLDAVVVALKAADGVTLTVAPLTVPAADAEPVTVAPLAVPQADAELVPHAALELIMADREFEPHVVTVGQEVVVIE